MSSDTKPNPVVIKGDFRRTSPSPRRRLPVPILLAIAVTVLIGGLALEQLWLLALGACVSLLAWALHRLGRSRAIVKLRLEDSWLAIHGDGYQIRLEAPFRYKTGVERKLASNRKNEICFVRIVLDVFGKPLVLEEQVLPGYLPPKLEEITGLASSLGIAELTSCTPFPGTLWSLIRHIETRSQQGGRENVDDNIASLFQLGNQQLRERVYSRAIDTFSAIIELRPDSALAYFNRGGARYYHRVELDKAVADLSTSLRLEPDQHQAFRLRGLVRAQSGDWAGMREDCTQAIRLQDNSADLYNLRGSACFRLQDYDAAIVDFNRAIQLDGSKPEPFFNRGLVRQRQMKLQEALSDFRRASHLNPRFDRATSSIAAIERHLARQRAAGAEAKTQQNPRS